MRRWFPILYGINFKAPFIPYYCIHNISWLIYRHFFCNRLHSLKNYTNLQQIHQPKIWQALRTFWVEINMTLTYSTCHYHHFLEVMEKIDLRDAKLTRDVKISSVLDGFEEMLFLCHTWMNYLHSTIIHCTLLYSSLLHCTILYCTILHCTILYCTILYCTIQRRSFITHIMIYHLSKRFELSGIAPFDRKVQARHILAQLIGLLMFENY